MPPWQGGGNMIADVTFEKTVFQPIPNKFEAGTGNIADAVGLGAALDYVMRLGIENIGRYEHDLLCYGMQALGAIPGVRLIGTAADKASVMSFTLLVTAPKRWGRRSTTRALRCALVTTARSPSCGALGWKPPYGHRLRSTTPSTRSTVWWGW